MSGVAYSPRRWWIAALFLLTQPVGFLYVGSPLGFFIFYAFGLLSYAAFFIGTIGWFATPVGILGFGFISATAIIFVAVAPIWMAIRRKAYVLKWYNRVWVYALAVVASLALTLSPELPGTTKKIETYTLSSSSMMPTIRDGDYLIADQRGSVAAAVKAGDVIVARYAHKGNVPYVHRVVGLPGDRVRLVNGVPEINGNVLKQETIGSIEAGDSGAMQTVMVRREFLPSGRSYLITYRPDRASQRNTDTIEVGADEFFILGDNRENSLDSTYPRPDGFGLLMRREISGIVTGFYWSSDFNRVGQRIDAIDLQ